ncbi:MAG: hypothetical protein V1701_10490 [Planctomycetota bacterium]
MFFPQRYKAGRCLANPVREQGYLWNPVRPVLQMDEKAKKRAHPPSDITVIVIANLITPFLNRSILGSKVSEPIHMIWNAKIKLTE